MKFVALDKDGTLMAKRLVHDVYVNQLDWRPKSGNPSNFRVVENSEGSYLDDDLTSISQYYALFSDDQMVACCRMITAPPEDLEASLYTQLPDEIRSKSAAIEINRVAIRDINNPQTTVILMYECLRTAKELGADLVLTTAAMPQPGELFTKLGFSKSDEGFRYDKSDESEVFVFHLDLATTASRAVLEQPSNLLTKK